MKKYSLIALLALCALGACKSDEPDSSKTDALVGTHWVYVYTDPTTSVPYKFDIVFSANHQVQMDTYMGAQSTGTRAEGTYVYTESQIVKGGTIEAHLTSKQDPKEVVFDGMVVIVEENGKLGFYVEVESTLIFFEKQ